jgi:SAM-dependent methyltransferase
MPEDRKVRILDAGAGEGYFAALLHQAGYTDIRACDYVEEGYCFPKVPFTQADLARELPFEDNSFDCVVSIEVIEHIPDHLTFMQELVRVTRPGGLLFITTPNLMSLSSRWHFFLYGYTDCAPLPLDPHRKDWFMQHTNPIGVPRLLFHLERNGAELIGLLTNRSRRGSRLFAPVLGPLFRWLTRRRLLAKKYKERHSLHERHLKWVLSSANLLGRITIAQARKGGPPMELKSEC